MYFKGGFMDKKLNVHICRSYPELFDQNKSLFLHFECDDGWFDILNNLCFGICNYVKNNRRQYKLLNENATFDDVVINNPYPKVAQVKEKFGTLRFYISGGNQYIDGLIDMAENMSATTCEVCGNIGEGRSESWIRTLCDAHAKNDIKKDINMAIGSKFPVYTINRGIVLGRVTKLIGLDIEMELLDNQDNLDSNQDSKIIASWEDVRGKKYIYEKVID